MAKSDAIVTLGELAQRLGAGKSTAKAWMRSGMPVIQRGRGRGRPTTLSLRAACAWLTSREVRQENDFSLVRALEYQARAKAVLRRLR
jgi:phage terminase Nu1 subunit (DNA packaging protein)